MTRHNTYDAATDTIVLDNDRAAAFDELAAYYADIYGNGRNAYAIPPGALTDATKQREMATFFWWTAWAASTNRPGQDVTYTQNWPHEELIGNRPTGGTVVWSVVSFVLLLAAVGGMVWYFASQDHTPSSGIVSTSRSAPRLASHAFAESHGQVLLRGGCTLGRTGGAGRNRGALRRRRQRLLRNSL